ncbi:glycosyltransferase family 4 protein [Bacteroides thetaiotaomicron]|uniref:glycosyltransferase family 4 protein n=1 Tax=Bacteroides thetaiotaomicron TaxID=818 RepID=UPI0039C42609
MIKVLSIGQLPQEVGGSYTTGVTRVVHELSKQQIPDVEQYLYATNVKSEDAEKICTYPHQYMGYKLMLFEVLCNVLKHPLQTMKEWQHYKKVCHVNPIRFEIYKANYERVVKEVNPDIVHIHGLGISPLYHLNKKYGLPILRTSHAVPLLREYGDKYRTAVDAALGTRYFADYDTALNVDNKNKLVELGVDPSKITIISNGIDTKRFFFLKDERESIRKENGATDDTVVFMTSGLLIDRKGQLSFLKILHKSGLNFQYWMLGKGPDWDAIKQYIEDNNLEDHAKIFGQLRAENIAKYLSGADFYSHASTTEAQSLAEIEAYSTGLRIVVNSKIADTVIGDAFNDKQNYYIMDFDNVDNIDFAQWVEMETPERFSRNHFDWSKIAAKYGELYHAIVEKRTK